MGAGPGLSSAGVPDSPCGSKLLPPVKGGGPHGVLPLAPPLGMGRAPASRHRFPEGGDKLFTPTVYPYEVFSP